MKRTNKGAQSRQRRDQPPAEFVEKRPLAKGNRVQTTVASTQGLESASIGLDRVREAAKRDKDLLGTHAKTDDEVDSHGASATPLPESTFLRLT